MALTVTISGSVGAGVGNFEVYFDSPCFSGSDGGPVTGSTPGTASLYSGSQIESVGGLEIDFPDNAQVAYIRTVGYSVNNDSTGSQYCSQCFGPVNIPGAPEPSLTPSVSTTPSVSPTPTPTITPTPTVSTVSISLTTIKLYASWDGSKWVGLSSPDDYCDTNYYVSTTFKTNAASFATLSTGNIIYDSSGAATTFDTNTWFAGGDNPFYTSGSSFRAVELNANGSVAGFDQVDCTSTGEPGGGQSA